MKISIYFYTPFVVSAQKLWILKLRREEEREIAGNSVWAMQGGEKMAYRGAYQFTHVQSSAYCSRFTPSLDIFTSPQRVVE